jgi:hypothetical protein
MADNAILKTSKKHPGFSECSLCGELFKANPADQNEMTRTFIAHKLAKHTVRKPREDFSQAAARIVREATEKD